MKSADDPARLNRVHWQPPSVVGRCRPVTVDVRPWRISAIFALLVSASVAAGAAPQRRRQATAQTTHLPMRSALARFPLPKGKSVDDLQWSPDGRTLAAASHDGQVVLLPSGRTFPANSREGAAGVVRVRWSPDGRQLAIVRGVLEVLTLKTGRREVAGLDFLCATWLPELRHLDVPPTTAGLVGVRAFPPVHGVTVLAKPYIITQPEIMYACQPILPSTRGVVTTLSSDGKVIVSRLSHTFEFGSVEDADCVVWRVRLRDGRILWHRALRTQLPEWYDYDRIAWSEPLQAAAVSFAGCTDGENFRTLYIVTRRRVVRYVPKGARLPTCLLSDPVWLGPSVIFAEGNYNRNWTGITQFDGRTRRRRVLFTGANEYRAPAVSPDGRKLAFAERKGGRWEVALFAVKREASHAGIKQDWSAP
jgi:dipeptidyl aminopeptidase/acylaminoacyl peptidase